MLFFPQLEVDSSSVFCYFFKLKLAYIKSRFQDLKKKNKFIFFTVIYIIADEENTKKSFFFYLYFALHYTAHETTLNYSYKNIKHALLTMNISVVQTRKQCVRKQF